MNRFARQFGDVYDAISRDIFMFCRVLGFEPSWQQAQLLGCAQRGDLRIAVRSGQGPGKTTASCIVGLWRSLQAVDAMTILTAPTMRQCNEVWLAESRRLLQQADPWLQRFVNITRTKIVIADRPDWGVKTVTATKEENAQGYHQANMTIIFEEASGIPRKIVETFKGTASNPNCMLLMIGNPNTRDCAFFDCFNRDKFMWTCLRWNAEESPRHIVDPMRNWLLAKEFGRDSDVYRIRVLGEFPHADPNCVMSDEDVYACMDRKLLLPAAGMSRIHQFGLDFARFGGDENVCYRRSGNAVVQWVSMSRTDPWSIVKTAFGWQQSAGWRDDDCWYVPDAGGIGQGIMHRFYEEKKQVLEFHNAGSPVDPTRYDNKVTEAYFNLARKVKAMECCLPDDQTLLRQLSARRYYVNKKGLLIIESKDDYMDRGFDSPDRAEACVMCQYDETETASQSATKGMNKQRNKITGGSLR